MSVRTRLMTDRSCEECVETAPLVTDYAKGRLGATTRVKHEIEQLIPNLKDNLTKLRELLPKLREKFDAYKDECNKQMAKPIPEQELKKFRDWYRQHEQNVAQFYEHVARLITIESELKTASDAYVSTSRSIGREPSVLSLIHI